MKIIKLQARKPCKRKEYKDRKQYNRLFMRKYRGGLPKHIIAEYERLQEKQDGNKINHVQRTSKA